MTSADGDRILEHLGTVAALRAHRNADPALAARVQALKAYQARRFECTYADLLAHPRYQGATRFFLHELYGPQEFSARDAQFSRIVPALVRLFPAELVATVATLAALHALSESLDNSTAGQLTRLPVDAPGYAQAWLAAGRAPAREQQIALTLSIGAAMDRYTRNRMLRSTLRLMRGPAQAAGLSDLQKFLEAGFDAFGAMKGASDFLGWVGERERALAAALFATDAVATAALAPAHRHGPLSQLP
ncbi:MAG: hypothetical protein H7242_06065 [Microbacteriaceae bacterium]|nr:hypothetical protein [Burkholderiaceae bacterium]